MSWTLGLENDVFEVRVGICSMIGTAIKYYKSKLVSITDEAKVLHNRARTPIALPKRKLVQLLATIITLLFQLI